MLALTVIYLIFLITPCHTEWTSLNSTPFNRRSNSVDTPNTNRTSWIYQGCQTLRHPPVFSNGSIYFGCEKSLNKLSRTGILEWSRTLSATIQAAPAIVRGTIYVGDYNGAVWSFQENGIGTQIFKAPAPIYKAILPSFSGSYIYVVSDKFYALFSNGTVFWTKNHLNPSLVPTIDANGNLYINLGDGFLSAYSQLGILRWRNSLLGITAGNPAIGSKNGYIYIGVAKSDGTNALQGYSTSGNRLYTVAVSTTFQTELAIDRDGLIYFASGNLLYTISETGAILATVTLNETCYAPCVSNNDVVVPCSGKIWGEMWQYNFGKLVGYSGCSIDDRGVIYVNTDKELYSFDHVAPTTAPTTIVPTITPTSSSPTIIPTTTSSPTIIPTTTSSPTITPTTTSSPTIIPTQTPTTNSPTSNSPTLTPIINHADHGITPGEMTAAILVPMIVLAIAFGLFVLFYRRRVAAKNETIPILMIVRKDDEPPKTSTFQKQDEGKNYYAYKDFASFLKPPEKKQEEPEKIYYSYSDIANLLKNTTQPATTEVNENGKEEPEKIYYSSSEIAELMKIDTQPFDEQEWYTETPEPVDERQDWNQEAPEEDYYNRHYEKQVREEE